ncbi:MAG: hypothetical protein ACREM6_09500 [Vulcanimicrobiaceae bacterium]
MILLATAFMALGLVNLDFGRGWWRGQLRRLAIGVPILLVYTYVAMPALVFPQAFSLLLLTLVPNAVYSTLGAARRAVAARRIVSIRRTPLWPYLIALACVALFTAGLAAAPVVDASGLRDVADATTSTTLPPAADVGHLRIVPEEAAIFSGNKVVGQLGTYYRVGDFSVQAENGTLLWVAPLEFNGAIQWLVRRTSPGVIVVSAEDPNAPAELRRREAMRYIPSALLNDNLYRHVYMTYGREQILETTLQLDDHGDPQYLCTLGRPTIGWSGQVVTAVVIVDPATGAMRRIARADFAQLPAWVSRVYPPDLALEYNRWFGLYVHGLWNSLFAKRDVHVPARPEVFGLLADGAFVWFVDHTSPESDQSMTGFTYMNARSGALTYYTSSAGQFNSRGAEAAVASNPLVRQGRLYPTQPILYNAFGRTTWVVPLVADTGKYQTLALVDATSGHVVVGNAASPSPSADAFAQEAAFLGIAPRLTAASGGTPVAGVIDRIGEAASGTVYFTLRGAHRIYALRSATDPTALLARSGDRVRFRSISAARGIAAASALSDTALAP